jgi:hypothetical protein
MFLILLDQKLHLAPIKDPKRVLDLGCGTGIWCMDMADGLSLPVPYFTRDDPKDTPILTI